MIRENKCHGGKQRGPKSETLETRISSDFIVWIDSAPGVAGELATAAAAVVEKLPVRMLGNKLMR